MIGRTLSRERKEVWCTRTKTQATLVTEMNWCYTMSWFGVRHLKKNKCPQKRRHSSSWRQSLNTQHAKQLLSFSEGRRIKRTLHQDSVKNLTCNNRWFFILMIKPRLMKLCTRKREIGLNKIEMKRWGVMKWRKRKGWTSRAGRAP